MQFGKSLLLATGAAAVLATAAVADQVIVTQQPGVTVTEQTKRDDDGAKSGLVAGALVGGATAGPVGAAVGAVAGAIGGNALDEPDQRIVTYTRSNPVPSVTYSGDIAVGTVLPETVILTPVPDSSYSYVYLDEQPVIVDSNHRIVTVVR